ncbi:hypothetical protein DFH05DRAFT_1530984 [Lentinula detonsa]|uniref:WD40 repeat-like protein n=1 Tax=Lentinula detonsa TaxID=2804962 RepID=A0A9W8TT22_9AGAR|nr:hypothetical protein DFH05DRAFT_1530984 [Lentinula detonsa]
MFSRNQLYKTTATLEGCPNAVTSLSFSAEARFIVATGDFGAKVWDTSNMSEVALPSKVTQREPKQPKRAFQVASWMYFSSKIHVLILGSVRGDIYLLSWSNVESAFQVFRALLPCTPGDQGSQVVAMDVFETVVTNKTGYFVTATLDGHVHLRSLTTAGTQTIFSIQLDKSFNLGPVRFGKTRDVYVFGTIGGGIMCLDRATGEIRESHTRGPVPMGTVIIGRSESLFVAGTGQDFQAYRLQDIVYRQTYTGPGRLIAPISKDIVFAEEETILVGGTDSGMAIVYNTQSGKVIQTLQYPRGGLVQSVASCTLKNTCFIAIAGSILDHPSNILIFKKHRKAPTNISGLISYPNFVKLPKTARPYIRWLIWPVIFAIFYVLTNSYFYEIKSMICAIPSIQTACTLIMFTTRPLPDEFVSPSKAHHAFTPFITAHDDGTVKVSRSSQLHEEYEPSSQFRAEYALVEALSRFHAEYVKASLKGHNDHGVESSTVNAVPRGSRASQTEVASESETIFL